MESVKFDNLVRWTYESASRRGVMRVGAGGLAAAALATLGLRADDAEGKKKKKKKVCACTSSDPTSCVNKKKKENKVNKFLNNNPCAYKGKCQAGVSGCPGPQCIAPEVTCGAGCCPAEFAKCCEEPGSPTNEVSCNPTNYNCCPANLGGGSCPKDFFGIGLFPEETVCCPPTPSTPRGWCAEPQGECCSAEAGGFSCPAEFHCCPYTEENGGFLQGPNCCPDGASCCTVDSDCTVGTCGNGCCFGEAPMAVQASSRTSGAERFHGNS